VPKEGKKITEREVQSKMDARVAKHKKLVGGVRFVQMIPKNPSGKILRKILREQAKAEVGDSAPKAARL